MTDSLYEDEEYFKGRTSYRLAFREFGTCMGIRCHDRGQEWIERYERIMSIWDKPDLMKSTPKQLQAITMVMFASALIPGGYSNQFLFF
jgi:hypothetical protein